MVFRAKCGSNIIRDLSHIFRFLKVRKFSLKISVNDFVIFFSKIFKISKPENENVKISFKLENVLWYFFSGNTTQHAAGMPLLPKYNGTCSTAHFAWRIKSYVSRLKLLFLSNLQKTYWARNPILLLQVDTAARGSTELRRNLLVVRLGAEMRLVTLPRRPHDSILPRFPVSPESAADLANQEEIEYGTLDGGSTMTFFRVRGRAN